MKIGEAVKLTGLTRRTIRFYTEKGLINPRMYEKNGREYRDYSDEDVEALKSIAQLRRALFSIEQIHRIKQSPEEIPQVLGEYYRSLKDAGDRIAMLVSTAQNLDRSAVTDMQSLSGAFEKAAKQMPLPERDRNPHFARFDTPEFAESPEVHKFHENQYKTRAVFVPPNIHIGRSRFAMPMEAYNLGTMTNKIIGIKSKSRNRAALIFAIIAAAVIIGAAMYVHLNYYKLDALVNS